MSDEIIETAKAAQEVAKATTKGLEVSEKVGGFVAKVLGEPIEQAVGILGDKLKYMRWERQVRLVECVEEINKKRDNLGKEIPVAPKLALPIIENASLEEDDSLQDLWVKLLASSQINNRNLKVRSAFIDLIKQLESRDVEFLDEIYKGTIHELRGRSGAKTRINFTKKYFMDYLSLSEKEYENIVDNLMRIRCIKSELMVFDSMTVNGESATFDKGYDSICLTELGVNFIEVCMK